MPPDPPSRRFAAAVGALALVLAACPGEPPDSDAKRVVGHTTVELDVAKDTLRAGEALLGNLVADAFLAAGKEADAGVQLALINGGALRCPPDLDANKCEGFVIPAGPITKGQIDTLMPFAGHLVVKTVTGAQLDSALERSVSSLPTDAKGWFLQVSSGFRYAADCAGQAQTISGDKADNYAIAQEGARVSSATLGGTALDPTGTYKVVMNDFLAAGSDGHVTLRDAAGADTEVSVQDALMDYLGAHDPVTPALEGRITLTAACTVP